MKYKTIGKIKIPTLGLGTWGIGGKAEKDLSQKSYSIKAIRKAIELGITHIDTSEFYAEGFTEELIGEAINPYKRANLFLTSKVWTNHLTYAGVIDALKSTLKRLKTDYLDLYLIHRPSANMDLKGTIEALEYLNAKGTVRAIGLSNFTVEQILEAEKYLKESEISAIQDEYNLLKRQEKILEFCKQRNIAFIAYRPLMRGDIVKDEIDILKKLAEKYGKTNAQIALNWLISKDNVVAIPKSAKLEHLQEISESIGWKMSDEDYESLNNLNLEQK
ncbi:MAG: aldo/keto reductase [Nanoarchaeota archaeon]